MRPILAVVPSEASFTNMTVNQRLRVLAQLGPIEVLSCYPESFPADVASATRVTAMPASSRLPRGTVRLVVFGGEVSVWSMLQKALGRRYSVVYCFQDASAIAGWLLGSAAAAWVVDVLDDPALELRNAAASGKPFKAMALAVRDRLFKALVRRADGVLTIGSSADDPLPQLLSAGYGVERASITPLPQAVALGAFPAPTPVPANDRRVFYVGWVSPLRGVDTLLAAGEMLRSSGREVEIRLAGHLKSDDRQWLTNAIEDSPGAVHYVGVLRSEEVLGEIEKASVCVCPFPDSPELRPVQPVKVLEYLAAGRPVVASRLPGTAAVIEDGVSGLLLEPGSAEELAEALGRLLDDPSLAQKMASEGRRRVQEFDVGRVNHRLADALAPWL